LLRNLYWIVCCYLLIPVAAGAQNIFEDGLDYGHTGRWSYVREGGTPDALRFSDTDLRDPHIFVDIGFPLGCRDVTDEGVAGVVPGFNEEIEASITGDDDGDGLLDSSTLLIFRPFDGAIVDGAVLMSEADCTAPVESTQCTLSADAEPHYLRFDGLLSGGNALRLFSCSVPAGSPVFHDTILRDLGGNERDSGSPARCPDWNP